MASQSVLQFPLITTVGGVRPTDLLYIIRGSLGDAIDYQGTAADLLSVTTTYSNLSSLVSSSLLIPGCVYVITDAVTNGTISIIAKTTSTFFTQGAWSMTTSLKSFGTLELTAYTSGVQSVSSVTVNGVTITSAAVPYVTSLSQTITNVAANINAFQSTYTAYAVGRVLVIQANTAGTTANGFVVAGNVTAGLTVANVNNMANGVAPSAKILAVEYNFTGNVINAAYDLQDDITYRAGDILISTLGYNPILNFRWGDTSSQTTGSVWYGAEILDSDFTQCFCINTEFGGSRSYVGYFYNSVWISCTLGETSFEYSRFQNSANSSFTMKFANVLDCDFQNSNFSGVNFDYCKFDSVDYFTYQEVSNINMSNSWINAKNFQLVLQPYQTINGSSGRGLVNTNIVLGIVPIYFIPDRAVFYAASLTTGGGRSLEAGLSTDDTTCLLPTLATSSLNGIAVITSSPLVGTVQQNIVARPTGATISAGSFVLKVSGVIGF